MKLLALACFLPAAAAVGHCKDKENLATPCANTRPAEKPHSHKEGHSQLIAQTKGLHTHTARAFEAMPGMWDVPLKGTTTSILYGDMIKAVQLFGPLRRPSTMASEFYTVLKGWSTPANLQYRGIQGWQGSLLVTGSCKDLHTLALEITLTFRGALGRRTSEALCRLTPQADLNLPRTCLIGASGVEVPIKATTWFYIPATAPDQPPADLRGRPWEGPWDLTRNGGALPADDAAFLANVSRMLEVLPKEAKQVSRAQYKLIYKLAVNAFSTLPRPFTVVESGNFCGGVTVLLALTVHRFCPACTFITVDPTLQAQHMVEARVDVQSCTAKKTLASLGLLDLATVVEGFGADLPVRGPIGLMYFDDGKIREANAPQFAMLEPYLMDGALVGFDDYAQIHCIKGPAGVGCKENDKSSVKGKVNDHRAFIEELVSAGQYAQIASGEMEINFAAIKRTRGIELDKATWAELQVELVNQRTNERLSAASVAIASAPVE